MLDYSPDPWDSDASPDTCSLSTHSSDRTCDTPSRIGRTPTPQHASPIASVFLSHLKTGHSAWRYPRPHAPLQANGRPRPDTGSPQPPAHRNRATCPAPTDANTPRVQLTHPEPRATSSPPASPHEEVDRLLTIPDQDDVDDIVSEDTPVDTPTYNPPHTPLTYRSTLHNIWPYTNPTAWVANSLYKSIYDQVRECAVPNYCGKRIPVPSALTIQAWRSLLVDYHDTQLPDFLEYGWPADYTAPRPPIPATSNHRESPDQTHHIQEYVDAELTHGALLGPFDAPPFTPWTQISPMMTRPKRNSNSRRVIVDLSYPGAASVNAGIRKGQYQGVSTRYTLPSIADLAARVAQLGTSSYLWCADLARAYRQLRACPLSTPLYGLTLNNKIYIDIAPPFGCRTSSLACARTTDAVVHLMRQQGHHTLCYLDDFVGVESSLERANEAYSAFLSLAQCLGLQLSPHKCVPPTRALEWLGFHISSLTMTVTIPQEKLADVLRECQVWESAARASRRDLQRLVGRLQHVAKCVRSARTFMSRILAALRAAPYAGKHLVPEEMKGDLRWFGEFARSSNGLVLIRPPPTKIWTIECDASLSGVGAFSPTHFYGRLLPPDVLAQDLPIVRIEAANLIVALKNLFPPNPHEYAIVINTDNSTSQQVLSSGAGRDPFLCACAREIWLFAATRNTEVIVRHKPGKDLILADALSRRHADPVAARTASDRTANLSEICVSFDQVISTIW